MLRKYPPVGSRPGVLAETNDKAPVPVSIHAYSANDLEEKSFVFGIDDLCDDLEVATKQLLSTFSVVWVHVEGIHHHGLLRKLADIFSLHDLTIGDIGNVPQRPKIEEQDDYLFIVSSMLYLGEKDLEKEQISIVTGRNFILTFVEDEGDVLDPVRKRIRPPASILRKAGPDYLTYAILDTIVDSYFPLTEKVGEVLEEIEERIIAGSQDNLLTEIYAVKRQMMTIRRTIWPHREIFSSILNTNYSNIKKATRVYFRDCYDHVIELIDVVEMGREMTASFTDIYMSSVSNKLNDVMKVLTVISTIFIPLSFVASLYGMNFQYMPELRSPYGYPAVLIFMLLAGGSMFYVFWKRGWLERRDF